MTIYQFFAPAALAVCVTTLLLPASAQSSGPMNPTVFEVSEEDPQRGLFFAGPVPRTKFNTEDASLNDVCCVGDNCWAVGERGVLVRSEDAGQSWQASILPIECSLKSVCFLTNQIGFVAGSQFDSHDRRRRCILLSTRDGGQTWQPVGHSDAPFVPAPGLTAATNLPPLTYVRFFDLENAIAIGRPDATENAGTVFRSQDGGKSWKPLQSSVADNNASANWKTGAFLSAKDGFVAGSGNALGAVVSDQLVTLMQPQRSLRQIRSASLSHDGTGWLAGDAALLQHTKDGGITWKPVTAAMPPKMADVIDLRAVSHRGSTVCAAGRPGSLVVQSTDGGASWNARRVPSSVPINSLSFCGDSTVIAVGALGMIHRSSDSGSSWTAVRNSGHRASVVCLATNPEDVSFRMLTAISGNEGFRSVVVQPSARLARPGTDDTLMAERMEALLPQLGANAFEQDWMFSRTQPLHNTVSSELLKTWEGQSDGRVRELLPQRLAELLRTWRPDIVCIDRGAADDQVSVVWTQALTTAMQISDGTDPRSAALDAVGLEPWAPRRIVLRECGRATSPLSFAGEGLLRNLGTQTDLVATFCRKQLSPKVIQADAGKSAGNAMADSYALHYPKQTGAVPHLLAGMMAAPGTESRRKLSHATIDRLDQLQELTRRAQQQSAALANQAKRVDAPLSLIAQLKQIGADLPDRLAMQQLLSLAKMYESVENLDGQIAVLKEITERFPETAEAADANELLFQFYSSEELRFLRQASQREEQASHQNRQSGASAIQQIGATIPGVARPPVVRAGSGQTLWTPQGQASNAVRQRWNANSDIALQNLRRLSPDRAGMPQLLLRQAANLRLREDDGGSSTVLSQAARSGGDFSLLARAEMQAVYGAASAPVPVVNLTPVLSKPFLDGRLSDKIWEDAKEIELITIGQTAVASDAGCMVMLGWDEDHIYISGRVERVPDRSYHMDKTQSRDHDAAHGIRDRIEFTFDTDRDYTTAFHFVIDEAGQTSDRCWKSRNWNPSWFAAADLDEQAWQFEIAIPQNELVERAIRPGNLWAMQIHRTVPGVLQQTLKAPESEDAREDTAGHGLLRFIRRRK